MYSFGGGGGTGGLLGLADYLIYEIIFKAYTSSENLIFSALASIKPS